MLDTDFFFRSKRPNTAKLIARGFVSSNGVLVSEIPLMDGQFNMIVTVAGNSVSFKLIENAVGDEYLPLFAEGAQGGFVLTVRAACEAVLADISKECFDIDILKAEQTGRVLAYIKSRCHAEPEFLWRDSVNAAIRRQDNSKWFAVLMTVKRRTIGLPGQDSVEVINLKAPPETVKRLVSQPGYYPAYHMNKQHWFTVCLDGTLADSVLFLHIDESFACAGNAK